jgi:hypothetical protein
MRRDPPGGTASVAIGSVAAMRAVVFTGSVSGHSSAPHSRPVVK